MLRAILAALAIVLLLSSCGGGSDTAPTAREVSCDPVISEACLIAGQNMLAGQVLIEEDATNLTITLNSGADWDMTEAHVHADESLSNFPLTNKGNPIPGQFEYVQYAEDGTSTFTFGPIDKAAEGWAWHETVYIAVHAVTWPLGLPPMVSDGDGQTMVTNSLSEGPGEFGPYGDYVSAAGSIGWHQNYPGEYPFPAVDTWEAFNDGGNDANKSNTWDEGINAYNVPGVSPAIKGWDFFQSMGADWIWEKFAMTNPKWGDVVYFQRTFEVPETATSIIGKLWVTVDNGYEAYANGTLLNTSATQTLGAGWFPGGPWGGGFPMQLTESYVDGSSGNGNGTWDSNTWRDIEYFDISGQLVAGINVIDIIGVNELMGPPDPGEADKYLGTPGQSRTSGRYFYDNPGGLIYVIQVEYITDSETAWAATCPDGDGLESRRFVDKGNWATYLVYTIQY